ncbi:MAG: hypothetical protein EAX95_08865 [Candidatus Thorarchaeota archaeon]|nr:hypothetical protein [Candidatus Thorarchaeota archaeon]
MERDDVLEQEIDSPTEGSLFGSRGTSILILLFVLNLIPSISLRIVSDSMMPFFIVIFVWAALYILTMGLTLYLLKEDSSLHGILLWSRKSLLVLILLTVVPRAVFLGSEVLISLDALWYLDFGDFMSWGDMPYADFYFPYPPVFGYFIYGIMLVAPAVDSYRILAIALDVLIVTALWWMNQDRPTNHVLQVAPFFYTFLPFSVIESGLNGHFEPLANLFLLVALCCLLEKREGLGAISLGLSIATKIYAGFILPILLLFIPGYRKKLEFILITLLTFFATFIPFSVPVWLRGDLLFPGTAMPGLQTGFFDAMIGFIFELSPIHLITISIVGIAALLLLGFFMGRSAGVLSVRTSLTYDILTFCVGFLFVFMSFLAIVYPYLPPAPGVFWRYPTNIALARGIAASFIAILLMATAWKRWRLTPERKISTTSFGLIASVTMLLLITLSKQVFYGWYMLWPLIPLLFLRDRRVVYLILGCMLLLYPSYTHDNFLSLGYQEDKTWSDEFTDTDDWDTYLDFADSGLNESQVSAQLQSRNGIGAFSVNAAHNASIDQLSRVKAMYSRDVSVDVTLDTEIVLLISSDWDPTFGRYADVELYFQGLNETGQVVSDAVIAEWQFSPKNITYVLWRFSFQGTGVTAHPVELTKFILVIDNVQAHDLSVLIDFIYTTEVYRFTPGTVIVGVLLAIPSLASIFMLERMLPSWKIDSEEDR